MRATFQKFGAVCDRVWKNTKASRNFCIIYLKSKHLCKHCIYNESWLNNKTEKVWHLFVCAFISLHFLILVAGPLIILIGYLIFLSTFLKVIGMSCTARIWNSLLAEYFLLTNGLSGFITRAKRHLFSLVSFYSAFLYPFHPFPPLFLVLSCLIVVAQLCMEWNPIRKNGYH